MCKCSPADRNARYCGRWQCDGKTHLRDALARYPEREQPDGKHSDDLLTEAALCIEMLGRRLKSSQLAVDGCETADKQRGRTLMQLQAWESLQRLDAQRKIHRRAQRAEGLYARLFSVVQDLQALSNGGDHDDVVSQLRGITLLDIAVPEKDEP